MTTIQQSLVQSPLNNPPTSNEDQQRSQLQDELNEEQMDSNFGEHQDIIEPEHSVASEPGKCLKIVYISTEFHLPLVQ